MKGLTQMPDKTALDSTTAIRYLNGDPAVVAKVTSLPTIVLPVIVANVLLITAETQSLSIQESGAFAQFLAMVRRRP